MAFWRGGLAACISLLQLLTLASAFSASNFRFDPLRHLAGIAPYYEDSHDPPTSPSPPQGCTPVRAAYLVRHAAIYANDYDYEQYLEPFIQKWENRTAIDWSKIPQLSFLASWSAPISEAEGELLTRMGKLEATQLGISLSFRYPNLRLPQYVFASSAERTAKSAQSLIRGFELDENSINLVEIYEGKQAGANSLTPYKSCPAYSSSTGSEQFSAQLQTFTRPIVARLNALAPAFNFTAKDVYGMMELCGYESVIRGKSPFCNLDLFSPDDWLGWEYATDIQSHYNMGYGNPISGVIGLPWLRATTDLLLGDDSSAEDLHVSFTHRELPPMVVVALGLFNNSDPGGTAERINETMPLGPINHRRAWKSSHILPFLGNIAIERLNCSGSYGFADGNYYRVLVNNAPQPLPECGDGPGTSCSGGRFEAYLQGRVALFDGYSRRCGVDYGNSTDVMSLYIDPNIGPGTPVGKRSGWEQAGGRR